MAPFDAQPIKSLPPSASRAGNVVARNYQSNSIDHHTIIDIVIMLVIFVALILSLSALAWFRPTLPSSFRATPVLRTAVPIANTATPVRSTPGRSIHYSRQLLAVMAFILHNWWGARASHNGIPRSVMDIAHHHEQTIFRAAQLSPHTPSADVGTELYTRSPSFTTFTPTSMSGAPSIVDTVVNSEAMELHILGGSKTPSTSSLAVENDLDITNNQVVVLPVTEIIAGTMPEAPDPC